MTRLPRITLAVLAASLIGGCGGEAPAGPQETAAHFEAVGTSDGQPANLPTSSGGVVVETAWFWADAVALVGDRARVDGDIVIKERALNLGVRMRSAFSDVPPGLYSRSAIDLEPPDEDAPPVAPEFRATYRITGRTADGLPFTIRDRAEIKLDLRAGDGVELRPGQTLGVEVRFDLGAWWSGMDLGALAAGNPLVIDSGPALVRFRENLLRSASLRLGSIASGVPRTLRQRH